MVSVIIPVYNGETYLRECLDSVVGQTYRDLEIIIVDDGSTDSSFQICRQYAQTDKRIRLIHQENAGVSAARNAALELAGGEYVLFVDADDMLIHSSVEILMNAMDSEMGLVTGSVVQIRFGICREMHYESRDYRIQKLDAELESFNDTIVSPWGRLYRLDIIKEHNIRFRNHIGFGEDHIFNMEYCAYVDTVRILHDIVYQYRLGGVATSVKYHENIHDAYSAILESYALFYQKRTKDFEQIFRQKTLFYLIASVLHHISHCTTREAVHKTEEVFSAFAPFLTGEISEGTGYAETIVRCVCNRNAVDLVKHLRRTHFLKIAVRKIKYRVCAIKLFRL